MSEDADALRQRLVEAMVASGALRTARIVDAFRAVPRHAFVPDVPLDRAYANAVVVTRRDERGMPTSSASEPGVMGVMLEQLEPAPGQRWLEIGAGTGYNAALIAWLVRPGGQVTTIDVQDDVSREAREHLARAGFPEVHVATGDGWAGVPRRAPYDRIEVTASCDDLSPSWVQQLAVGGLVLLPLQLMRSQALVCFRKEVGRLVSTSIRAGGFMPLQGHPAEPWRWPVSVLVQPWSLQVPGDLDVSVRALVALLDSGARISPGAALPPELWAFLEFEKGPLPATLFQQRSAASHTTPRRLIGILEPDPLGLAVSDGVETLAFGATHAEGSLRSLAARRLDSWRIEAVPADSVVETDARVLDRAHYRFVVHP